MVPCSAASDVEPGSPDSSTADGVRSATDAHPTPRAVGGGSGAPAASTPLSQSVVRAVFEDSNQYMKDGILIRQLVNLIDEIDFEDYTDRHAFGEIYETLLKELQSAGSSGEYYTPRAVTDFMIEMINPRIGETVADFAAGTAGFLTSTLKHLDEQVESVEDHEAYRSSVYGIEKKPMPYLLGVTNLLLHDVDQPQFIHGNSLERNVRDFKDSEKFDVVTMKPALRQHRARIGQSELSASLPFL